jgi:mono/diheme cytochrome c family protein
MGHTAFDSPLLNAHPAMPRAGAVPSLAGVAPAGNGLQLWRENCAGCHGADARGDGPAAAWLTPAPGDLVAHSYSRDYLVRVMWNGLAGTSMPAWRDQPLASLAALIDVVRGFSADDGAVADDATLRQGAVVYATHCVQCHGAAGRGDGFAAGSFKVAAVDFTARRPTLERGLAVMRSGVPGTPMAPWGDRLTGEQMRAVVQYLRGFYEEASDD